MSLPHDRKGDNISLNLEGKEINDERILELVPNFRLDPVTAALFGGDRLWRYDFPFAEIDRKIIAIEYADFAGAITGQRPVEVDIVHGTRSVAVSYAILESGVAGRPISIEEVLAGGVEGYQREINEGLGI
jgi:hypothetical protein